MQTGEGTVSVSRLQSDCGLLRRGVSQERVGLVGLSNSPVGLVRSLLNKEALSSVPTLTSASPLSTRLTYRSTHTDTPHANSLTHIGMLAHLQAHITHTGCVPTSIYSLIHMQTQMWPHNILGAEPCYSVLFFISTLHSICKLSDIPVIRMYLVLGHKTIL